MTMVRTREMDRSTGEVVSREELLAALWPGVIVGDNALTQVVTRLRKALGDTAQQPTYIEAISKRGYRLIAEVKNPRAVADQGQPGGNGESRPTLHAQRRRL